MKLYIVRIVIIRLTADKQNHNIIKNVLLDIFTVIAQYKILFDWIIERGKESVFS